MPMCPPSPVIRTARAGDEQLLAQLIRQAFTDVARRFGLTPQNCPKHPSNCTPQWLESDFSRGVTYFVMEIEGQPVGCAAFELAAPELGYLERLAVAPPFRRNGFGLRLAAHVLAAARAHGVKQLSIGIIADQIELKQWYRRIGFVQGDTKAIAHLPFAVTFMSCAIPALAVDF